MIILLVIYFIGLIYIGLLVSVAKDEGAFDGYSKLVVVSTVTICFLLWPIVFLMSLAVSVRNR